MNAIIENALKEYGLDTKEIIIYTTALEIGETTAGALSEKANIQRELTYIILKRLEKKGVISTIVKNGKKHFEAANPAILLKKIDEKHNLLKQALPELKTLNHKTHAKRPSIQIFQGIEGIKAIFNVMLKYNEDNPNFNVLEGYGSAGKFEHFLRWSLPHFIEKRAKAKIKFNAIYNETNESLEKKNLPLSDIRFLPKEFESSTFHFLYPNHVAMIIFSEEPLGILIESKDTYNSYKLYFNILWKSAKK